MDIVEIRVNCPDMGIAQAIADHLVGEGLVASANIHAPVRSNFRWKGTLRTGAEEFPLMMRTRRMLFDAVATEIRRLHPYEVPGITATLMTCIDAGYREWVLAETAASCPD